MKLSSLREYQLDFEKIRPNVLPNFKELFKLVESFKNDFSSKKILNLNLDSFVVGKRDPNTFCNRIENELNEWGNIHGSTAKKFGIYYGVDGIDINKQYRIGKASYGPSVEIAFENVKLAIVDLINNPNDLTSIKNNPISPMFKGKILSIYFPEKFLNIFSASHLNYFINELSLENNSKSEIDKQNQLLTFKNSDSVMAKWSIFEFSKFLYHSFGKPNDELKNDKLPEELSKLKLKDFPPIESINAEFVNLKTEKSISSKSSSKRKSKKTDYSSQSKRFKKIGDRGEQIVVMAERKFLLKKNKPKLVKKVDHVAKYDDSAGYDIKSFDENGVEKYIEVKSTLKPIGHSNIFISSNELSVSNDTENYYFYIVYEVGSKQPKIWKIKGTELLNDKNIKITPSLYKVTFKTK